MAGMDAPMMEMMPPAPRNGRYGANAYGDDAPTSNGRYGSPMMEMMPPPAMAGCTAAMGGMGPQHMEMMPPAAMGGMDAPMMERWPAWMRHDGSHAP